MFLYRNDPIVKVLLSEYDKIKYQDISYESLEERFSLSVKSNNYLKGLVYAYKMYKEFPGNIRGFLNYYDMLMALKFYFDAEILIKNEFYSKHKPPYQNEPHQLVFERYYDFLCFSKEFSEAIELAVLYPKYVQRSGKLRNKIYKLLLDTKLYNKFYKALGFIESIDFKPYTLSDLMVCIQNDEISEALEIIWNLYAQGENSKLFFKLAIKVYNGEVEQSTRVSFFINEAYKNYPYDEYFVYHYCSQKLCLGFYEKSKSILQNYDIKSILLNLCLDKTFREDFYHLYIKLQAWCGYEKNTLLTNEEALFNNLMRPYELDAAKVFSLKYRNLTEHEDANIFYKSLKKIHDQSENLIIDTSKDVDLILTGQIRGLEKSIDYIQYYLKNEIEKFDIHISTWDKQALVAPRFHRLYRFFDKNILDLIPSQFYDVNVFTSKFPLFINKIKNIKPSNVSEKSFRNLNIKSLKIESDEKFENLIADKDGFKVRNVYNQSKMFYKIDSFDIKSSYASKIIRSRIDISPKFNFRIAEYLKATEYDQNVLYTNYFGLYGACGDQFWIGSSQVIFKMSKIWSLSIEVGKLVYSNSFDRLAHFNAAECLCIEHAIALGIDIRFIPSIDSANFNKTNIFDYISLKDELVTDYSLLSVQDKKIFKPFFNHVLELVH